MTRLFLIYISFIPLHVSADTVDTVWYDEDRKIKLYKQEYNDKHQSFVYTESPDGKSTKHVLTGRIVLSLHYEDKKKLQDILHRYSLILIKKMNIGKAIYLLKINHSDHEDSLKIANRIYEREKVKASYPDWLYLW